MFCIDFQIVKRCIRKNKKRHPTVFGFKVGCVRMGFVSRSCSSLPQAGFKCRRPAHDQLQKPNLNKKVHTQYIHDLSHAHNSLASLFQAFNEFLGEAQV